MHAARDGSNRSALTGAVASRRASSLVALLLASLTACLPTMPEQADPCATWAEPGLYRLPTKPVDARNGAAQIYIPPTEGPRRVVVALHGGGTSIERFQSNTRLLERAEADGHVVVFPRGLIGLQGSSWNAGSCCGLASATNVNDVGFLDALAEDLRARVCPSAIEAVGHSNGAMMALRWSCEGEGPDALGGSAAALLVDGCRGRSVPTLLVHGADDTVVPLAGGANDAGLRVPPFDRSVGDLRARNQCTDAPPRTWVDGDTVCRSWDCEAPVSACVIEGWGHRWPGGRHDRAEGPRAEDLFDAALAEGGVWPPDGVEVERGPSGFDEDEDDASEGGDTDESVEAAALRAAPR